jgi:hypothetical protein
VFKRSVVVTPLVRHQLFNATAAFLIEARDEYRNPLGADANHGRWNLGIEEYLDPRFVRADVCGGAATTNQELFWQHVLKREQFEPQVGRRKLLQAVAASVTQCEDILISFELLGLMNYNLGFGTWDQRSPNVS